MAAGTGGIGTAPAWPRRVVVGAVFAAIVVVIYRPYEMLHRLPRNVGDPAFVTWTLAWGARSLTTNVGGVFQAPIFWPHPSTLAYSDPLLPLAPVYGVLHTLTGSRTVSVGLIVTALVVLNLVATYLLALRLTGQATAAVLAAIAFAVSDFATSQWGHIQLQTMGLLAVGFLLLFVVLERARVRDAVGLGLLQGLMVMTAASVALAWAVAAPVAVAVHLVRLRFRPPAALWRALAVAAAVTAVALMPLARPYLRLQRDPAFRRPASESFHIGLLDLLTPSRRRSVLPGLGVPVRGRYTPEREYFPSATALVLAAVGIVGLTQVGLTRAGLTGAGRGRVPWSARSQWRGPELAMVAAAGAACLIVALGPRIAGVAGPYRLLHDHVPGFAGLRVASRFAMVTILAVAVLAAAGLTAVLGWLRAGWPRAALGLAVVGAAFFELAIPVKWKTLPTDRATLSVFRELARRPPGAVVELPMADVRDGVVWSTTEGPRLVYATIDWHPRVNGYSGFVAPGYERDRALLSTFPSPCAVARARVLGARWVVLDDGVRNNMVLFDPAQSAGIVARLPPGAAARYGTSWLIDLDRVGPAACSG